MRRPILGLATLLLISGLSPQAFPQRVIATIAVGNRPIYLAVDPTTNRIYVSNQADDTVSVIDGTSNTVLAVVNVGHFPNGIAVNPKTNTIYVANLTSGTLSIINGTTLTTSTLWLGPNPAKVAVNTSTNRVYVTLENQNGALDVVDGRKHKIIASIGLPPFPLSVAIDRRSNQVYVADFLCGCGQVSVIDGKTNEPVNTIALPGSSMVVGVAVDLKNEFGYAADENSGFYVIDLASGNILGKVADHNYPNEVAAIPGTSLAVEPDTGSDRVVFVSARTLAVKKQVRVGKFPTGVAVNAATKRVYVANRLGNTVSVIELPSNW
jgi:YVTN family beta-propeller protein